MFGCALTLEDGSEDRQSSAKEANQRQEGKGAYITL